MTCPMLRDVLPEVDNQKRKVDRPFLGTDLQCRGLNRPRLLRRKELEVSLD